ncbi:hypothetical protein AB0953_08245 [Streptomyces sp. NPDC046866]|uniref:hypothetical protein n=1 Tax=Streptomyces sp. NPDC046866 TaxID=3154921 RepID=UPI003454C125
MTDRIAADAHADSPAVPVTDRNGGPRNENDATLLEWPESTSSALRQFTEAMDRIEYDFWRCWNGIAQTSEANHAGVGLRRNA